MIELFPSLRGGPGGSVAKNNYMEKAYSISTASRSPLRKNRFKGISGYFFGAWGLRLEAWSEAWGWGGEAWGVRLEAFKIWLWLSRYGIVKNGGYESGVINDNVNVMAWKVVCVHYNALHKIETLNYFCVNWFVIAFRVGIGFQRS